jgi:hypothetical protein
MKMAVVWVTAPCGLAEVYRRFTGACCRHHQGAEAASTSTPGGARTKQTAILRLMDVIDYVVPHEKACQLLKSVWNTETK